MLNNSQIGVLTIEYWANLLMVHFKRNEIAFELLKKVSLNRYQSALEAYKGAFGDD